MIRITLASAAALGLLASVAHADQVAAPAPERMQQIRKVLTVNNFTFTTPMSGLKYRCRPGAKHSFATKKTQVFLHPRGRLGRFVTQVKRLKAFGPRGNHCRKFGRTLNTFRRLQGTAKRKTVRYYRPVAGRCTMFLVFEDEVRFRGVPLTFHGTYQGKSTNVGNDRCRIIRPSPGLKRNVKTSKVTKRFATYVSGMKFHCTPGVGHRKSFRSPTTTVRLTLKGRLGRHNTPIKRLRGMGALGDHCRNYRRYLGSFRKLRGTMVETRTIRFSPRSGVCFRYVGVQADITFDAVKGLRFYGSHRVPRTRAAAKHCR